MDKENILTMGYLFSLKNNKMLPIMVTKDRAL
jgi:hypothetical protein